MARLVSKWKSALVEMDWKQGGLVRCTLKSVREPAMLTFVSLSKHIGANSSNGLQVLPSLLIPLQASPNLIRPVADNPRTCWVIRQTGKIFQQAKNMDVPFSIYMM
jgi:hypothetical protein